MQVRHQKVKIWTSHKPKNKTHQKKRELITALQPPGGRAERKKQKRKKAKQGDQRLKSI